MGFRDWFRRKDEAPEPQILAVSQPMDWVVMPYRIAEACRISMFTVASHPEIPDSLRVWIAQWLERYNEALSGWFQENYGPDIFPILGAITNMVRLYSEDATTQDHEKRVHEFFQKWEDQLQEGNDV